ncbi:MAG TPA: serine/threonine-protein kinase [Polyangiaceae bacterium]|nr:serine/threonine-protein kinase [Polyangiaceae bacterium]
MDRRVGAGGMGEVYLVQHVHTDERLAVKVLLSEVISDETALERFRREARTPARIDSEYVVRVTDADAAPELGGAPFLVMEYLRGEDLDHFVAENGPMTAADVVTFLGQAARALDKAHALGIVHRDLKPENIFITRREDGSPHIKILDFGIAKFTSGATSDLVNKTATSPGQIYGTPLYMSPEQAKGESKKISPQTDIWALGLIANRMLSGKDYWDAETLTALIAQVVYEPMKKPSEKGFDFGPKYDAWFLRCCDRDPDARFGSAGEAVFRLGQALGVIDEAAEYSSGVPSRLHIPAPAVSRDSFGIGAEGQGRTPRPLSKTELQLAQTGMAGPPSREKSWFGKIAIAAGALGILASVVFFVTRGGPSAGAGHQPADPEVSRVGATPSTAEGAGAHPTATTVVTPVTSDPAASATPIASASAAPAESSKPVTTKAGSGLRPPKPPTTATSAPTVKDPPKPPPTKDPLDTRT